MKEELLKIFTNIKTVKKSNNNWEYLGIYHNPYSKKQAAINLKLIDYAKKCNFLTNLEANKFEVYIQSLKVQTRHAAYIEKLKNLDVYRLTYKTTDPFYLKNSNFKIKTLANEPVHYVSSTQTILQLKKDQFQEFYKLIEDCVYVNEIFVSVDGRNRVKEFKDAVEEFKKKSLFLDEIDITPVNSFEDWLYQYIYVKEFLETGLHETNKIKELDNFIENPTKYLYEYESKNNINIDFDEYALVDKLPEE